MSPRLIAIALCATFALTGAAQGAAPVGVIIAVPGVAPTPEFASVEYEYEVRGTLVFGEKPTGELLLKKQDGNTVWQSMPKARVKTFEQIFADDKLTFLTQHWDAKIYYDATKTADYSQRQAFRLPDRKMQKPTSSHPYGEARDVKVLEKKTIEGELWLKVKLVQETGCTSKTGEPVFAKHPITGKDVEGWVPLKNDKGELNFWFYSRGC